MGFCGSANAGPFSFEGVAPAARWLDRRRLGGKYRETCQRAAGGTAVEPTALRCYVAYIVPAGFDGSGFQQTLSSSGSAELPGMCSKGTNAAGCADCLRTIAP